MATKKISITGMFNDVFTNYENQLDSITIVYDPENRDCNCEELGRKCWMCSQIEKNESKTFNNKIMESGIELIKIRYSQDIEIGMYDAKMMFLYQNEELIRAAEYCLDMSNEKPWPESWDNCGNSLGKSHIDAQDKIMRLIHAGAFSYANNQLSIKGEYSQYIRNIANEIDRCVNDLKFYGDGNDYTESSIRTYSGKVLDFLNITPESIDIIDICHGMGKICRWGGQPEHFYSVLQHSIAVCDKLPNHLKLAGLLHDAPEGLGLGDMPSPVKKLLKDYKKLENELMAVIAQKFGFEFPFHKEVKRVDAEVLAYEWNNLIIKKQNKATEYYWLEIEFMNRFNHEMKKRNLPQCQI